MHVLNGTLLSVQAAKEYLRRSMLRDSNVATAYALAGCDFSPATHGIGHEMFLGALLTFRAFFQDIGTVEFASIAETNIDESSQMGCVETFSA